MTTMLHKTLLILTGVVMSAGLVASTREASAGTVLHRAQHACADPAVVDEFGHGSSAFCVFAMQDELSPGQPRHLRIEEDGSGSLLYVTNNEWRDFSFPAGTFTWDCRTDGNLLCGSAS
jgi:hypothetical protein